MTPSTAWRASVVEHTRVDPEWDAFVESVPGGSYQQSSRWAEVKASVGWSAARIHLHDGPSLAAGCQLLVRRVGRVAGIAFVPRGPLLATTDPAAAQRIVELLDRTARRRRLVFLKVQAPAVPERAGRAVQGAIEARGYVASELEAAPTTTVVVDLTAPLDALEAGMRRNARRNIARCRERGVAVRAGTAADLPALFALLDATARRQGFGAYPHAYYAALWDAFAPGGHARLLLAEQDGVVLAGQIVIAHGALATNVAAGRSAAIPDLRANELLHLAAMEWAQRRGALAYDLNGVDLPADGKGERPEAGGAGGRGVTHFKLGLGGEVVRFPGAHDRLFLPGGSRLTRVLAPRLGALRPWANRLLGRGGG